MKPNRALSIGPLIAAAICLVGGAAGADDDAERGARLFAQNCAACHGAEAQGDGPMAAILNIAPPDLTQLSSANGGSLDRAAIARRIDGRDMLLAHGGPMPLFGAILEDDSAVVDDSAGNPVFTTRSVLDIVAWIETRQN